MSQAVCLLLLKLAFYISGNFFCVIPTIVFPCCQKDNYQSAVSTTIDDEANTETTP